MKNLIYGLVDPRTLLVRYVGKSVSGLTRPKQHRMPSRSARGTHVCNWTRSLLAAGLDYTIVVLEEVSSREALADTERFWIAYGRALGWPLTNLTDGGEGTHGHQHTAEARVKIAAAMSARRLSPEHRAKIGLGNTGKKRSSDQVRKLTEARVAAWTGRKHTAETRAKMVEARRNRA